MRRQNNLLETTASLTKDDQPFTMKDLLDLLTARELESGEDCLRLASLNFNGLAGMYLMQYEHHATRSIAENNNKNDYYYIKAAIRTYERVVDTAETYKDPFHADSFQLAHAYYNLAHSLSLLNKIDAADIDVTRLENALDVRLSLSEARFCSRVASSPRRAHSSNSTRSSNDSKLSPSRT